MSSELINLEGLFTSISNVRSTSEIVSIMRELPNELANDYARALVRILTADIEELDTKMAPLLTTSYFVTEKDFNVSLFLDVKLFKLFKLFMSDVEKHKEKIIVFLSVLTCLLHKSNQKHEFIDMIQETKLISELKQLLRFGNHDVKLGALEFFNESLECKRKHPEKYIEMCTDADILSVIDNIHSSPTLSCETRVKTNRILLMTICYAEVLPCNFNASQISNLLQKIMFQEDEFEIRGSLMCFVKLFSQKDVKREEIIQNMKMEANNLRMFFMDKAKYDKLIFDKTLQKYISNEGEFAVPIVIQMLIEQYYTLHTVKKVEKMEFDSLKRFVHLIDPKKYSNWKVPSNALDDALRCFWMLIEKRRDDENRGILQSLIGYPILPKLVGFLSYVTQLRDLNQGNELHYTYIAGTLKIIEHFLMADMDNYFSNLPFMVSAVNHIHLFRKKHRDVKVIANNVMLLLICSFNVSNPRHLQYLKKEGMFWIMIDTFVDALRLVPWLGTDSWLATLRAIITTVVLFDDDPAQVKDSVVQQFKSFDRKGVAEEIVVILDAMTSFAASIEIN